MFSGINILPQKSNDHLLIKSLILQIVTEHHLERDFLLLNIEGVERRGQTPQGA